jgi:hypothetical protein
MVNGNTESFLFGMIMACYRIAFRDDIRLKFGLLQSRSLF